MWSLPSRRVGLVIAFVLSAAACSSKSGREPSARSAASGDAAASRTDGRAGLSCRRVGEAGALALAEASGATFVPASGGHEAYVLVVGDSDNDGAYLELRPDTGAVIASGKLPLDGDASDDLEGLSAVGDVVHGVTSSGWMRHWRRRPEGGYDLIESAYPISSSKARQEGEPGRRSGPALICRNPHDVNCASNYEGMCLRQDDVGEGECAGFAASKESGILLCLVRGERGRLSVDPSRLIRVAHSQALTGCHFEPDGDLLWAGANAFGGNAVYRIRNWQHLDEVQIDSLPGIGSGFCEAIAAVPGHVIYRFSDTAREPSLFDRFICE